MDLWRVALVDKRGHGNTPRATVAKRGHDTTRHTGDPDVMPMQVPISDWDSNPVHSTESTGLESQSEIGSCIGG
jgi:hypothetical protein